MVLYMTQVLVGYIWPVSLGDPVHVCISRAAYIYNMPQLPGADPTRAGEWSHATSQGTTRQTNPAARDRANAL